MSADLLYALTAAERAVWEALLHGDAAADRAALAPDFLGIYPDGFADRDAHVAQLAHGPSIRRYTLSDLRVTPLGPDHAALSYRADFTRGTAPEAMYVTSIWRRRGTGWVNLLSQDTPAPPP